MLISTKSEELLQKSIINQKETYCSGLFLSARWFVFSEVAGDGVHMIIMPDRESAEYCSADLYNLIEGDNVFYLPDSGKRMEKSNFKSSLAVQRTSAIGKLIEGNGKHLVIVTYPEALEEKIPAAGKIKESVLTISTGEEISHDKIKEILSSLGFEKTDFVSAPGQYAIRGSIVDIFSYSFNDPFRISFFGNEVEKIHIFDSNTQLSKENVEKAEIYSDILSDGEDEEESIISILPASTTLWLDSSDMYKEKEFFKETAPFRKVYLEVPISADVESIKFNISPQPVFNKNFELLTEDIRTKIENNYKVYIYGEKQSQLERLKSILSQNGGLIPVPEKNIHAGFIDNDNKVCCYSDHEIFDRFHRVALRRTVEKTEQLTLNDLSAFNIGDYIVHIDHGVGIFGGLVRMRDDKGRMHEVVKLMYKDGDVVFVSVHSLHKISRYKSKDAIPPKINKLGS